VRDRLNMPVSTANNARQAPRSAYWRGYLDGSPFILVVEFFGLLFGVVSASKVSLYSMQYLLT